MIKNPKYNREFQHIDTQEKAYLLGYFYGDGCIHKRVQKKVTVYSSSITSLDWEIIFKFKENFKFFNVLTTKSKYKTLVCSNPEFYEDLKSHGIVERKSTKNKDLLKIPKIDEELVKHFIRGLYDSDGGYYLYGSLLETFFCSTSKIFITEVLDWFESNGIKLNLNSRVNRQTPIYFIRSKSNVTATKFYELIYKDATIFMERKKNVFLGLDSRVGELKNSENHAKTKGNDNQLKRLYTDYKNVVDKYKNIVKVDFPSVCCDYHTVVSGKSYKKNIVRDLFLCLKCGKKSVYNKVLLKQDELLETP